MYTKQGLFDLIVSKVLEQGMPSADEGGYCMYRGIEGRKCAIGHLIPDDIYDSKMEGSFDTLKNYLKYRSDNTSNELYLILLDHGVLLSDLQNAHDNTLLLKDLPNLTSHQFKERFKKLAKKVAEQHYLNYVI